MCILVSHSQQAIKLSGSEDCPHIEHRRGVDILQSQNRWLWTKYQVWAYPCNCQNLSHKIMWYANCACHQQAFALFSPAKTGIWHVRRRANESRRQSEVSCRTRRATGFDIAFCLERSNTRARHQVAPVKKILKPYFDMLQHYSRVITASS